MRAAMERGYLDEWLRRRGHGCKRPVVPGRNRCEYHGGLSTGPRTAEGRARALENLWRGNKPPKPPKSRVRATNCAGEAMGVGVMRITGGRRIGEPLTAHDGQIEVRRQQAKSGTTVAYW
jgi:hypothetical protein